MTDEIFATKPDATGTADGKKTGTNGSLNAEITKPCPDCGHRLVIRTNRQNGIEFLGCSHYPECRHTEPVTEYLKLRAQGAEPLF